MYGTKLELERTVYQALESQCAAAGYKLDSEHLSFNLDLTYTEMGNSNAQPKRVSGSASITFKDIIRNFVAYGHLPIEDREQNLKDSLTISAPGWDIDEDGNFNYDITDINTSYSTSFWNNITLELDLNPFAGADGGESAWDTLGARATWDMKDGKMMILSADASGRIGLEGAWRIDSKSKDTYAQSGLKSAIANGFDGAMVGAGMVWDPKGGPDGDGAATPSLSLTKSFSEAVDASINLTSAKVSAKLSDQYGGPDEWYGNIDLGASACFGVDYPNPLEKKEEENGSYAKFKAFAKANLDMDIKKNLVTLGNNFGEIVFSARIGSSLGQTSGVIKGISFRSNATWQVTWKNDVIYDLFGFPMNIHPHFGGAVGFSMHSVESDYFGTEYKGYQFSVGMGTFGISWELHSRKTIIQNILKRKRYASWLPFSSFLPWGDEETDEDYIARAWPCLVYNIINWAKEDYYTKKFLPDVKLKKKSIWKPDGDMVKSMPGHCDVLKTLPDIGMNFQDFYTDVFQQGTAAVRFLNQEAYDFYTGGSGLNKSYATLNNPTSQYHGQDLWEHWVNGDDKNTINMVKQNGVIRFPLNKAGAAAPPSLRGLLPALPWADVSALKGKWIDQAGQSINSNHVIALTGFNGAWKNWPNMEPDTDDTIGTTWGSLKGTWGPDPCRRLFARWKRWKVNEEQMDWIKLKIDNALYTTGQALQLEIDGLQKDKSVSDSLFSMFFKLAKGIIAWFTAKLGSVGLGPKGKKSKAPLFDLKGFLETKKSLVDADTHDPIAPIAGSGNGVGASSSQAWVGYANHQVRTHRGASKNMSMITQKSSKEAMKGKREEEEKDEDSAIDLYYADPVWGLVKAYFTYMAPIGEHESLMDDPDNPGKKISNPDYLKPYDPRTAVAQAKRLEIRERNNKIINGKTLINDRILVRANLAQNAQPFNVDAFKTIKGQEIPIYRDKYGNLNVELFKDYRAGWVYKERGASGTQGGPCWVVPVSDFYRYDHAFDFDEDGNIIVDGLSFLAGMAGKGGIMENVTNVCRAQGGRGFLASFFGSGGYFMNAYRSLPWIYTDADNANLAQTKVNGLTQGSFSYYPSHLSKEEDLPYPNSGNLSYQQVPWKGNTNSAYLDFYEFMTYVEMGAKDYFFPELMDAVTPEKIHNFCMFKERAVRAFGILEDDYVLKDCKSCGDCETRPANKGDMNTGALGEVVGLRSMLGEPSNPSDNITVSLSESVTSFYTDEPWYEYKAFSVYGSIVNVYDSQIGHGYVDQSSASFGSLGEKFKYVFDRIIYLQKLASQLIGGQNNQGIFQNSVALVQPFTEDTVFWFPNTTDPNRVSYAYLKGDSISNPKEIASLRHMVDRHVDIDKSSNIKRMLDISYNLKNMLDDFNKIASDAKHAEGAKGQHKYTDYKINPTLNSLGSKAVGKEGVFNSTSAIAVAINKVVREVKSVPSAMGGSSSTAYFGRTDLGNLGVNTSSKNPVTEMTASYAGYGLTAKSKSYLDTPMAGGGATIGEQLFTLKWQLPAGPQANTWVSIRTMLCEPLLNSSYIDYSHNLIEQFMPQYSELEWIFSEEFGGPPNNDTGNVALLKDATLTDLWEFTRGDLRASRYMASLALTPWTLLAADVIGQYWTGRINYTTCIWHLNRRLWPLITAMNQASPNIYMPLKDYQKLDLKPEGKAYLAALKSYGLNPVINPTLSRDFYAGWARSQFDAKGGLSSYDDWKFSNDDVVFAHRDNVLKLLFYGSLSEILPKGGGNMGGSKFLDMLKNNMPLYRLAVHQAQADIHTRSFYDVNQAIIYHWSSFNMMNSLCAKQSHTDQSSSGESLRPGGRDRFDTGESVFCPIKNTPEAYTTRIFGDDYPDKTTGEQAYSHPVFGSYPENPLFTSFSANLDHNYEYHSLATSTGQTALIRGIEPSTASTLFWQLPQMEYTIKHPAPPEALKPIGD